MNNHLKALISILILITLSKTLHCQQLSKEQSWFIAITKELVSIELINRSLSIYKPKYFEDSCKNYYFIKKPGTPLEDLDNFRQTYNNITILFCDEELLFFYDITYYLSLIKYIDGKRKISGIFFITNLLDNENEFPNMSVEFVFKKKNMKIIRTNINVRE